ncbi:MAG: DAK2 domain-containing protein [Clostridia bacterium]|nr:DAK2 domain-containing protein [Clostridia bacterium]
MSTNHIDANILYNMLVNGYRNLMLMEQQVNDLNVFPVPDGDTGTNMVKTLAGGVAINVDDYSDVSSMMAAFSKSVLLAARGNSGVILSQYIRGWANAVSGKSELEIPDIKDMFRQGVKSAYGSVPNPVEGTMLTVIREPSEALDKAENFEDIKALFAFVIENMKVTLQNTPELLPVLKEAGVVDCGGMGIIYFTEGIWAYLNGEIIKADSERESTIVLSPARAFGPDSVLEYGYCTEFVLQLMNAKTNISTFSIGNVISYLETVGDSIVAVQDDDIVKVHVHTFTPEKVLGFARNYGEFISVKIENMSVQHNEISGGQARESRKIKYAVIAVANGEGVKDYFVEIGATRVIEGGQTQNPSTQDFLNAFNSVNAEHIVVLPNNSNIYATAIQAADMYEGSDVHVLKTKSIAEGYSALSMMNTWSEDIDSFIGDMTFSLGNVTSAEVTKAVRDATVGGVDVKEGMYMGIADGKILYSSDDSFDTALGMIKNIPDIDDKAVITVFYGESVSEETANKLISEITDAFPEIECGAISGKQKLYDYYIAVE